MTSIKEPCVLVPASDLIELIQVWEKKQKKFHSTFSNHRMAWYYNKATSALSRFNRHTMQDS